MIRLLWTLSILTRAILRRYMPTNILLDAIRTRRGLKFGIPAMVLAVPYIVASATCFNLLTVGGPGWLNLLNMLCLWNTMKFIINGPVSLIMLILARGSDVVATSKER